MPLESTIICLDTSEFMRNGDFTPTRHESQQDAANLVVGAKMQQNPESSVGVLTMASTGRGAGARVLVSPTDDMGNILNSLHNASVGGQLNFVEGVQVAQLALKHRRNKNGAQRIVAVYEARHTPRSDEHATFVVEKELSQHTTMKCQQVEHDLEAALQEECNVRYIVAILLLLKRLHLELLHRRTTKIHERNGDVANLRVGLERKLR